MVVVPALTPDNYNAALAAEIHSVVVVPALTPDNYNPYPEYSPYISVVVPALTPDNYNLSRCDRACPNVVVPG